MDRFDLGSHTRPVSTSSADAQRWFDCGLNWCFGFNQEEGVKCFERALTHDPECVMAHWGVAYGSGPFYNLPWRDFGEKEANAATALASEHIRLARASFGKASPVERRLVDAIAKRFQASHSVSPEEFDLWDDAYAAEMRRVYDEDPDDHDVAALFVEALITRTPRRLWNVTTGLPARHSDVVEALDVCDRAIAFAERKGKPRHPAIAHMHIHALEMSNYPERALQSADILADLRSDAGHMNHMPGHIYVLCGDYDRAKITSERAIEADNKYAAYAGSVNFYITARCHDLHLMMFTCMFLGQYGPAIAGANMMQQIITKEVLTLKDRPKLTVTTEAYYGMKMHVLVRFGRWHDIIDLPLPDDPDLYVVTTPMYHYARGIAFATLKNIPAAERERDLFHESFGRVPKDRKFLSNLARDTLGVGEKMLEGELEYHKGTYEIAFAALRESVRRDDALGYTEPWAWMHPPRHALAALLLEQAHYDEAESVYRDDLGLSGRVQRCTQHPDNVWALHGLVECLEHRRDAKELPELRRKLAAALVKVDVPITSSCLCRTAVAKPTSCCSNA